VLYTTWPAALFFFFKCRVSLYTYIYFVIFSTWDPFYQIWRTTDWKHCPFLSSAVIQRWQKCTSSPWQKTKGMQEKFSTELKSYTDLIASQNYLPVGGLLSCVVSARWLGSQIQGHWVYFCWNAIGSSKVCYWTQLFHWNGLQASWVQDKLNSSWCFFRILL